MMRKIGLILCWLLASLNGWCQMPTDVKCMTMMDVPLEGTDSVFIPALQGAGFQQVVSADDDPDTYYFKGDFYGIKDAKLMVSVNEKTRLLTDATVMCGPYRTRELFERNQKYLIGKLQREWGNFKAKGDGSLHTMTDYGYIRQSTDLDEEGRHTIKYFYMNMSPYYKDAANMGLKGFVQEVITENPVGEEAIMHFDEWGKLEESGLTDRQYSGFGYIQKAAQLEASGEKSTITYEYDDDCNLHRQTIINTSSGLKVVNEFKYNDNGDITQQSKKVFDKQNECVMSINMKNSFEERDDTGNWTKNTLNLTYWETGQRAQMMKVDQTRTISYFHNEKNLEIIQRLRNYGLQMELSEEQTAQTSDKLAGQSIVISGVFAHHSRDEYKAIIEQNGGKNVGSISNKTSFILAGENMGPSKLQKAEKLGIRIMSEDEFLEMLNA